MKKKTENKGKKQVGVAKIILYTIAGAGVISMAMVAPNALQALSIFPYFRRKKYNTKYYIESSIYRFKNQGLVEFRKRGSKTFLALTPKGKEKLLRYRLRDLEIKKPKGWDGKWRVLVFDIKETRRFYRDKLRIELVRIGFVRLQNSVWVFPYDCRELVLLLKTDSKLGKSVVYMVVDQIENDHWLRKKFSLN